MNSILGPWALRLLRRRRGDRAYHAATLLKLYIYGYLNRVQSSRRLEREAKRNVELMWLTGRLAPDHKTIANFRREHGPAIQAACAQFIVLCRQIGLFAQALAAIDGSKFKAVNTRDKNFTKTKLEKRLQQVEAHIAGYLQDLETADRHETQASASRTMRLREKVAALRAQMQGLKAMQQAVEAAPDGQISLTDPDARSMATSGRGSGMVGYNVQTAVDAQHHLIVAHEVVMTGSDRQQLSTMAVKAKVAMGSDMLEVLADRGYFAGEEILACETAGVIPFVPKPFTSGAKADGRFGKQDFTYIPEADVYRCPAGQHLPRHMTSVEKGLTLHRYWDLASCRACPIKGACTPSKEATDHPLGARGGDRRHAAADGLGARRHALTPQDRGAPLRHDQSLDGPYALPDETAEEREDRDQPPRPGLQPEAGDRDPGREAPHRRPTGLTGCFRSAPKQPSGTARPVLTQPGPMSDLGGSAGLDTVVGAVGIGRDHI